MTGFFYNDLEFRVVPAQSAWDILRKPAEGEPALVGANLFAGLDAAAAEARALALVQAIYPVGVRIVGPDVGHPLRIGDLEIVGPDLSHPVFVHWNRDSASCPKQL
jgi:hypothetical protein